MRFALLFALVLVACKTKDGGTAASGSADKPTDKPVVLKPAAAPPKVTPDMLFATEPVWTVEALPRGLWYRVGDGPVVHKCRQEFALTWAQNVQLRLAAKAAQDATTADPKPTVCGPKAGFTVCTFTDPKGDLASNPKALVHWVFTGTDTEPIMIAVLYGKQDDLQQIEDQLAKIESCPRPSSDPEYQ